MTCWRSLRWAVALALVAVAAADQGECCFCCVKLPTTHCGGRCLICMSTAWLICAGCDCGNLLLTPAPVCGAQGVTYINRCMAECQGAEVQHEGACGAPTFNFKSTRGGEHILLEGAAGAAAPPPVADFSQVDASGSVSAEELSRFSQRGYHLSAKLQLQGRRITERGIKLAAGGGAG